ncbi:N-acetylmuramoyl-L-alanine amidase [Paenibacillus senegalensis]|uniref:N-acetylmuramoyl-L-alanine amidase n=1 Tax=Paenibacillus senegalensis TaxID=1465766 RepID=UPI00028A0EDF|nr:N-acetylmuramoyl-L-alanine amidase [Paenibacillus senegalensis]
MVWGNGTFAAELIPISTVKFATAPETVEEAKFRIVIDAGHGGKDPGAIGASGAYEKDFNLSLAKKLYQLLEQEPLFESRLTREDDQFIELEERTAMANDWYADVLVSIHANTFEDPAVSGTETLYYNADSIALAEALQGEVASALNIRDRGMRKEDFVILTSTQMPSVIVEVGYLTNPQEETLLLSSDGQDRAAKAIFEGLKNYFSQQHQRNHDRVDPAADDSALFRNRNQQLSENKIIFSGPPDDGKKVALTFDDGPNPTVTPKVLDILKENDVQATFFILGQQVNANIDLLRRIIEEGHAIGNHSWSHPKFDSLSVEEAMNEIEKTQSALENAIGYRPSLFRPPYGALDNDMLDQLQQMNLMAVNWTVDTMDWSGNSAAEIMELVREQIYPGGIILLHDSSRNNRFDNTLDALEILIPELKAEGYSFVTVPEMLDAASAQ